MRNGNQDGNPIRPYSLKELAAMYHVSKNTFKKWLKPISDQIGERKGYYYSVHQVQSIFDYLGIPEANRKK